jgi:hypothetical protein
MAGSPHHHLMKYQAFKAFLNCEVQACYDGKKGLIEKKVNLNAM